MVRISGYQGLHRGMRVSKRFMVYGSNFRATVDGQNPA